jgi:prepilin-type N-terminal cleavage/methylation domain-containing protein
MKNNLQKGFTLIELLVVIGILGIIAAAVLAAINPIEQLKKAQDTSLKSAATEFVNANVRYYTTHNSLPWFTVANGGANCYGGGNTLSSVAMNGLAGCITSLVTDGELKQSYTNASYLNLAFASNPNPQTAAAQDTIVCFMPQSKAQQLDANTKYTQAGAIASGCKSQGGANNCYWCAQ